VDANKEKQKYWFKPEPFLGLKYRKIPSVFHEKEMFEIL
jgi:hypothetical protein